MGFAYDTKYLHKLSDSLGNWSRLAKLSATPACARPLSGGQEHPLQRCALCKGGLLQWVKSHPGRSNRTRLFDRLFAASKRRRKCKTQGIRGFQVSHLTEPVKALMSRLRPAHPHALVRRRACPTFCWGGKETRDACGAGRPRTGSVGAKAGIRGHQPAGSTGECPVSPGAALSEQTERCPRHKVTVTEPQAPQTFKTRSVETFAREAFSHHYAHLTGS